MSSQVSLGTYQESEIPQILPPPSPLLEYDQMLRESSTKKSNIKDNSCISQILDSTMLNGLQIAVSIKDTEQKEILESILNVAGAKIVNEAQRETEFIITDSQKNENNKSLAIFTLAMGEHHTKPRFIQQHQIQQVQQKIQKVQRDVCPTPQMVVLADAKNSSRPNFMFIREYPRLCFFPSPSRDFFISPFVQIPPNMRSKAVLLSNCANNPGNKNTLPDGPVTKGYCEICSVFFHDAKEHRNSSKHLSKIRSPQTFALFDVLSKKFNRLK